MRRILKVLSKSVNAVELHQQFICLVYVNETVLFKEMIIFVISLYYLFQNNHL